MHQKTKKKKSQNGQTHQSVAVCATKKSKKRKSQHGQAAGAAECSHAPKNQEENEPTSKKKKSQQGQMRQSVAVCAPEKKESCAITKMTARCALYVWAP